MCVTWDSFNRTQFLYYKLKLSVPGRFLRSDGPIVDHIDPKKEFGVRGEAQNRIIFANLN